MGAVEALRELGERWALVSGLPERSLMGGASTGVHHERLRDQLIYVAHFWARATYPMIAEAYGLPLGEAMRACLRHQERGTTALAFTTFMVRGIARDGAFADRLMAAVAIGGMDQLLENQPLQAPR